MYAQSSVWLEKKNDITFKLSYETDTTVAIQIDDSKYNGYLALHIDKAIVPDFIECLQKIKLEDKKCETTG